MKVVAHLFLFNLLALVFIEVEYQESYEALKFQVKKTHFAFNGINGHLWFLCCLLGVLTPISFVFFVWMIVEEEQRNQAPQAKDKGKGKLIIH